MNSIKKYLDRVKAEDDLKEKTKAYVSASLWQENKEPARRQSIRNAFAMKKLIVSVSAVAICAVLALSGYAYSNTAVNYVSLDINPSVELGLNAFDKVVSVEGVNEDGQNLVREQDLNRLTIEEAIRALVEEAVDQDYIAEDGSTVIAVTAESDNEDEALQLQQRSAQGVNLAMDNKGTLAVLYQDCSNLDLRTEAKDLGISPGKFKLIKFLQTLDPDITVEQYQDTKVSDIIDDANQLLAGFDDDSEIVLNIKNTAKNMEQNREQHINQNGKDKASDNANSQNGNNNGNANGQNGNNGAGNANGQNGTQSQPKNQSQDQSCDGTMDQTRDQDRDRLKDQSRDSATDNDDTADTSPGQNGSSDKNQQNNGTNNGGKNN